MMFFALYLSIGSVFAIATAIASFERLTIESYLLKVSFILPMAISLALTWALWIPFLYLFINGKEYDAN
jgi:hypothetical protein